MKKIFVLFFVFVALAVGLSFLIIPSTIKIKAAAESSMNSKAAGRYLGQASNWSQWWPGKAFDYSQAHFRLNKIRLNSFELEMFFKKDSFETSVQLIPSENNHTGYTWACELKSSNNPAKRWMQYFDAIQIKKHLDALLDSLKNYIDKSENVYGFNVQKVKVTDSVLISTRRVFERYPDEKEIDTMIQLLKKYISSQHAIEKNYPMLNVHQNGTNDFEAMVAIATERLLPANKDFAPKLVLKGGNILEAEFKGGPMAIRNAFAEFENYRSDFNIASPAIPYQLIITDRIKEPDTTKWVTKFYYPVF